MPVRRIGLCYRSVSGRVPMGAGRPAVAVESTLERDFAILQRFDPEVSHIEEQPVRIEYRDAAGARRRYVPDFLVHYVHPGRSPHLVEVKFSTDPMLVGGNLDERLAAARAYAAQRGWTFAVVTEKEIRTPRLANVTFLVGFLGRTANAAIRAPLLTALRASPKAVEALASEVAGAAGVGRGEVLPTIWAMLARSELIADLESPLTMLSELYLPEERQP